ncbi:MAG: CASTOR/POLLUX-related putative ion channel [Anaerolineae bacterium]
MRTSPRLSDRLRYQFDCLFSRGTVAMVGWLGVLSLTIVLTAAAIVSLAGLAPEGEPSLGFREAAWASLMRTLDPGTMGGDTGWGFRLVMFGVTIGGVLIISSLIGVLSTGIESRLEELRKGRSRVVERNHTVILGWSEQAFTILAELAAANANQRGGCLVVMGPQDKVVMEDEIRRKVKAHRTLRIVCRTGNPMEFADLEIVSLNTARSIIVLGPEGAEPDSAVIKTVLAITNHPDRRPDPYHIVAELREPHNLEVAAVVGRGEVEWVLVGDLIARIIAQTCRQSGLSTVYQDLLDFDGDEFYLLDATPLVGCSYAQALSAYEHRAVVGILSRGAPSLNPPMATTLHAGDSLIVIAPDDDPAPPNPHLAPLAAPQEDVIAQAPAAARAPERTAVLGWNWRGPAIVRELDQYVAPGSELLVVADCPVDEALKSAGLVNQSTISRCADVTSRATLDGLGLEGYGHVILLSYSDTLDVQAADARSLITLLHLRDIADRRGAHFSIVSEMLDIRNRNLADVTRADDFIVSDRLVSLLMAQVSENGQLNAVFAELFSPEGAEVYLRPAGDYVRLGVPVNYYSVVESARRRGESAVGYRLRACAADGSARRGVTLNPPKSACVTFSAGDHVIVLAAG